MLGCLLWAGSSILLAHVWKNIAVATFERAGLPVPKDARWDPLSTLLFAIEARRKVTGGIILVVSGVMIVMSALAGTVMVLGGGSLCAK